MKSNAQIELESRNWRGDTIIVPMQDNKGTTSKMQKDQKDNERQIQFDSLSGTPYHSALASSIRFLGVLPLATVFQVSRKLQGTIHTTADTCLCRI